MYFENRRPQASKLSLAVVIASVSRPELLAQMTKIMASQARQPDMLVFSVVSERDVPEGLQESDSCRVLRGPKGLCAQRNTALDWLGGRYDIVVFYDDDFVPARSSLANIEQFFAAHPDVVGATGNVVADGINTAGISFEEAQALLARHDAKDFNPNCVVASLNGLYGCNMAYRAAAIGTRRFDERLKLYAWQEDIDFAASLRDQGRIVKTFAFSGVHQGVKHGRTPGVKLGYSQIINPAYLVSKGTMPKAMALKLVVRNVMANHLKAFAPEPWVDRIGRAKGNWIGFLDLVRGRLTPERIEEL